MFAKTANMVGTPTKIVTFQSLKPFNTGCGRNVSSRIFVMPAKIGTITQAVMASVWNIGRQQSGTSLRLALTALPMATVLLKILTCDSIAPFGRPVVPDE